MGSLNHASMHTHTHTHTHIREHALTLQFTCTLKYLMVRSFANFFVRPTVLARFAFADPATTTQAPPLGHGSVYNT